MPLTVDGCVVRARLKNSAAPIRRISATQLASIGREADPTMKSPDRPLGALALLSGSTSM